MGISPPWTDHEKIYLQEITVMGEENCMPIPRKWITDLKTHHVFLKLSVPGVPWDKALGQAQAPLRPVEMYPPLGSSSSPWWEHHQPFITKSWPGWLSVLGGKEQTLCTTDMVRCSAGTSRQRLL